MGLRRNPLALTAFTTLLTTAFAADRTASRQPPKQSSAPTPSGLLARDLRRHHRPRTPRRPPCPRPQAIRLYPLRRRPGDESPRASPNTAPTPKPTHPPPPPHKTRPAPKRLHQHRPCTCQARSTQHSPHRTLSTPAHHELQQFVTQRMLDYIDKMPPDSRFEVLRLTTTLSIVQGFTSDREVLKAAVSNKKKSLDGTSLRRPRQRERSAASNRGRPRRCRRQGGRCLRHAWTIGDGRHATACPLSLRYARAQKPHLVRRLVPAPVPTGLRSPHLPAAQLHRSRPHWNRPGQCSCTSGIRLREQNEVSGRYADSFSRCGLSHRQSRPGSYSLWPQEGTIWAVEHRCNAAW